VFADRILTLSRKKYNVSWWFCNIQCFWDLFGIGHGMHLEDLFFMNAIMVQTMDCSTGMSYLQNQIN